MVIFDIEWKSKVKPSARKRTRNLCYSVRFLFWYNKRKPITTAQASYKVLEGILGTLRVLDLPR